MGATVWQRDGQGGKTFTTGVRVAPTAAGKRKLVWKREDHQASACGGTASPTAQHPHSSSSGHPQGAPKRPRIDPQAPHSSFTDQPTAVNGGQHASAAPAAEANGGVSAHRAHPRSAATGQRTNGPSGQQPGSSSPAAAQQRSKAEEEREARQSLIAAQAELEALKASIAGRQAKLAREQREAQARIEFERRQREDLARRKARLESGFKEAFKLANEAVEASGAKAKTSTATVADAREVSRVLTARDDYEVFYLRPGACAADVRKRYKDMAVALHPDRCRVAKATDAFQRLVHAYQNLLKLAK